MSAITNIDGALTRIDNIRNNIQQFNQASLNLDNLRNLVSNATIISTTIQERIGRLFIALQQLNIDSPEVTANAQELSTLETELERVLRELSNLIPSQYPPNSGSGTTGNDDGGEGGLPELPPLPPVEQLAAKTQRDETESEPTFLTQMPTSTQPQTGGYNWRSNHRSRTKSKSRSKSVSKSHSKVSKKSRKQKKKSKKSKTRKHRR